MPAGLLDVVKAVAGAGAADYLAQVTKLAGLRFRWAYENTCSFLTSLKIDTGGTCADDRFDYSII